MSQHKFIPSQTAVLIVDLQNDFLHPEGAYGRSGTSNSAIADARKDCSCCTALTAGSHGLRCGKKARFYLDTSEKVRPFLTQGDSSPVVGGIVWSMSFSLRILRSKK